jgi:hypothetical protein
VAFWHIGQITGRVFAELDGDPELFAAVGKLVQQASMSMLGLE